MEASFYTGNRKALYEALPPRSVALVFSGYAPLKTGDENYPFFADRNFVYLTGMTGEGMILMAVKGDKDVKETLFILPPDPHAERWTGKRIKPEEASSASGIEEIAVLSQFERRFHTVCAHVDTVFLDLEKLTPAERDHEAQIFARRVQTDYPQLTIRSLRQPLRVLRTIKKPCEIEALKVAADITRDGIIAMMKASKPGMYEYQYKAEFDYALAQRGVITPGFPSIISAGENNFCIHYYAYTGQSRDGDMILNDVGACWDNLIVDVSRGWPANGHFSEKQRLLYTCAYNTSNHMFSIIKPGMPMRDVDRLAREYNFEQLRSIGLLDSYDEISKYMWHGGAHHIGFDVHDVVDYRPDLVLAPGMVFCVDIGIYVEEWGIGFRLEDNCLVTEDGCVNLTASIPRSIEEIETIMRDR